MCTHSDVILILWSMGHSLVRANISVINLVFLIYLLIYICRQTFKRPSRTRSLITAWYNVTFVEETSCMENMNKGQVLDRYDGITSFVDKWTRSAQSMCREFKIHRIFMKRNLSCLRTFINEQMNFGRLPTNTALDLGMESTIYWSRVYCVCNVLFSYLYE